MLVIGLTGGIGAGKSTVAAIMAGLGATVVDCDELGRVVVAPGGGAYADLITEFGTDVLGHDGQVDRAKLAAVVFADSQALQRLNAVTHPAIDREIADRIAGAETDIVVLDMAVLVETNLGAGQYHEVVVVEAPLQQRLERLRITRGMSHEQAMARIASQASDQDRQAVAHHVIRNDGSHADLRRTVERLWRAAGYHHRSEPTEDFDSR